MSKSDVRAPAEKSPCLNGVSIMFPAQCDTGIGHSDCLFVDPLKCKLKVCTHKQKQQKL
jgi:hypothetical protein